MSKVPVYDTDGTVRLILRIYGRRSLHCNEFPAQSSISKTEFDLLSTGGLGGRLSALGIGAVMTTDWHLLGNLFVNGRVCRGFG